MQLLFKQCIPKPSQNDQQTFELDSFSTMSTENENLTKSRGNEASSILVSLNGSTLYRFYDEYYNPAMYIKETSLTQWFAVSRVE